ncbi:hypothetical protein D3C79_711440 [compost metagenome]
MFVGRAGDLDVEDAVVDLDIAEELVVLGFTGRNLRGTQGDVGRFAAELETVAVQVVAVGGDEAQLQGLSFILHQAQLEGFMHRQKIGAVVQRRCAQGGAGAIVEQASADGGQGQEQKQEAKQAAHGGLAGQKCLHDNGLSRYVQLRGACIAGKASSHRFGVHTSPVGAGLAGDGGVTVSDQSRNARTAVFSSPPSLSNCSPCSRPSPIRCKLSSPNP